MAFSGNRTLVDITYPSGNCQEMISQEYPGKASIKIHTCRIKDLPVRFLMTYYSAVTEYLIKPCDLYDPYESLRGCCNQEQLLKEMQETNQSKYEINQTGINYKVIEHHVLVPVRECWCKFIYDIMNTNYGIIRFAPPASCKEVNPYHMIIKGELENTRKNAILKYWDEMTVKFIISFEFGIQSRYNKTKKADFIYHDIMTSEYFKIRQWGKYTISDVQVAITIARFPPEFVIELEEYTLRTTSLANCQSIGKVGAKVDCHLDDCWCTAYNSLRTKGSFDITIPLRIVTAINNYCSRYEYTVTIQGKVNPDNNDKMDLTFKFESKYNNAYSYYDNDF